MELEQIVWSEEKGWEEIQRAEAPLKDAQLVIVFGHPDLIVVPDRFEELRKRYPLASFIGGSTAGNVMGVNVTDQDIVVTAVKLEKSTIRIETADIENPEQVQAVTEKLVKNLIREDLKHIFVLSDGIHFNGSDLVRGLNILNDVSITGGLLADQGRFTQTFVLSDDGIQEKKIVLVAFYGEHVHVGAGCFAGWDEFGVDRVITKSRKNVVYAVDGQPALELYKKYLGEFAADLPASGLRFPMSIKKDGESVTIIRTLLAINEEEQSLTFAGDVPEGSVSLLMKGNIDNLILSAAEAAKQAKLYDDKKGLGIVISCVGRKLLMDQMTDDEIIAVQEELGVNVSLIGFYSNGELAPYNQSFKKCEFHNQTMTLTTIYED